MKLSSPALFRFFLASCLLLVLHFIFGAPGARAQTPTPIFVPVSLAPLQRDTLVELVSLTLDANVSENNGHTIVAGYSTFKLHNTDHVSDTVAAVGFPTWAGDQYQFDPARFNSFAVSVDGIKVKTLNPGRADLKIGSAIRSVDWFTFTVPLDTDEKKTVRFDFEQDVGDSAMPRFFYGLIPANNWKGSIGSARLTLNLPEATTLDQIVAYDPPNPEFDGKSITWRFTEKEPVSNPSLTILRPSVWSDLNAKRRASQQNPNDANARAALGGLLRQLAAIDSPRRDSFSMQAVAELETAVRLDANNRAARQALGAIYESRAGPATGPRNIAYVSLAVAQWEPLAASDANARKQLAEDYFYLGLDTQTRQDYAGASTYFDKASALAPNGAGPLFTVERMNAQRRALNIAWARALLDQNDAPTASATARAALGDKFMAQFTPPLFYVTKAEVTTSAQARTMIFSLAPYLAPSEMQNAASGVVALMRQIGTDANLAYDGSNAALIITVTFSDRAELAVKLDALAKLLPNRADWALVRAVVSPDNVEWSERDEFFTHTTRYREDLDLSAACNEFNMQISNILKNVTPLDTASANDNDAQLKRALLGYAQRGWQNALSLGRITYRAGADEARVDACAARTLEWSSSAWRPERVGLIVAGIELVGAGILIWRWRRGKRKKM